MGPILGRTVDPDTRREADVWKILLKGVLLNVGEDDILLWRWNKLGIFLVTST